MNKSLNDAVFDTILQKAFLDAAEQELQALELPEKVTYDAAYQKAERKAYHKKVSKCRKSFLAVGSAKKVAIVVVCLTLGGLITTVPKVGADFRNFVTTFYEKYFTITANNTPLDTTQEDIIPEGYTMDTEKFTFGYIPKDYTVFDSMENSMVCVYRFSNRPDGRRGLSITIAALEATDASLDNENSAIEDIQIQEQDGYYIHFEMDDSYAIVWADEIWLYTVEGFLSKEELVRVAENVSGKES